MVDKIDKTTLKILLFIVFLVILYLIVNRKKQIKEGFFFTLTFDQARAKWMLEEVTKLILKEGTLTTDGIVLAAGHQKSENSDYHCLQGSVFKEKRFELKADLLKNLRENIAKITPENDKKEMRTTAEMTAEIKSKLGSSYNKPTTPYSIINYTFLPQEKVRSTQPLKLPYHSGWSKSGRSRCDIYMVILGFRYQNTKEIAIEINGINFLPDKNMPLLFDDTFFKLLEHNFVYEETDTYREVGAATNRFIKESQTIANRFIDVLNTGGILEDIETKIVNDPDHEDNFSVKAAIQIIVEELKSKIEIKIKKMGDTIFEYSKCEDAGLFPLDKEECSKFRTDYVSETTDLGDKSMKTNTDATLKGGSKIFQEEPNNFMRIGTSDQKWMPKGCSYRSHIDMADGHHYGIHYSDVEHVPHTNKTAVGPMDLICKKDDIDIDNYNYDYDIDKLKTEHEKLSSLQSGEHREEYNMLDALIKLLEGTGITTTQIGTNSDIIQAFIKTNTDEKLKEFEEKEHNTMMKSHGFF